MLQDIVPKALTVGRSKYSQQVQGRVKPPEALKILHFTVPKMGLKLMHFFARVLW